MAVTLSNEAPPWSDLPTDIVNEVVGHLDIFSTARLTGVCRSLATAIATNTSLPFDTPCLLMSREDDHDQESGRGSGEHDERTFSLLDLSSTDKITTYPAFIRAISNRWWVGAKGDWLATVDEQCNMQLVNPYSGDQINLPAINTIPDVELTGSFCEVVRHRDVMSECTLHRIVICETPSGVGNDADYLVIAVFTGKILAITRGGDQSWTSLKNPHEAWYDYSDAIVHKGKVFAVDGNTNYIYAWDLCAGACPEPELVRLPWVNHDDFTYPWNLAESADGRRLLLLVCTRAWRGKVIEVMDGFKEGDRIWLYELDVDAVGSDCDGWSRVTSLGDHALFIGVNYPFLASVNRGPSEQLIRPNCVYFAMNELPGFSMQDSDVVVFDLDDQEYRQVRLYYSSRSMSFQTPIWFTPTFQSGHQVEGSF